MVNVVCAIIIDTDKKILLTQRSAQMSHSGMWEFPGGKVRDNEDLGDAIEREIAEEIRLKVQASFQLKSVRWNYGKQEINLIPIFCRPLSLDYKLQEHENAQWLGIDELLSFEDLLDADKAILPELQQLIRKV